MCELSHPSFGSGENIRLSSVGLCPGGTGPETSSMLPTKNQTLVASALTVALIAVATTFWFGAQVMAPVAAVTVVGVFMLTWAADLVD